MDTDLNAEVAALVDDEDAGALTAHFRDGRCAANHVFMVESSRFSMLPVAIDRGWTDLALMLLDLGAHVDRRQDGQTPLMRACAVSNHALIEAILSRGPMLDVKTPAGECE